jgi:hypothetical protein
MIDFKEWAKDKVFYSTNKDYIQNFQDWMIMGETDPPIKTTCINGVVIPNGEDYSWRLNNLGHSKIKKELEGWVYKEDYEKDTFKYQNPDMWNPIPNEYRNIKIKQQYNERI